MIQVKTFIQTDCFPLIWEAQILLAPVEGGGGGEGRGGGYTDTTIIPTIIPFRRNEFVDSEYSKRKQVENVG